MNLGKFTRHLRILEETSFTTFTRKHDPMDSNETSVVISLQIVAFINGNWTNPHDIISNLYLDFIFYKKKLSICARNKFIYASVHEFSSFFFNICFYNITKLDYYKFHIVEYLHIVDFHVI